MTLALATLLATVAPAEAPIALEVLFEPKWVCTRPPCGGERPPFRSPRIAASALVVEGDAVITPAGRVDRAHVSTIRIAPPGTAWTLGGQRSPEDMVVWKNLRRTFGALTVRAGMVFQDGQRPRPLSEARMIEFGETRPEQVTDEGLRIGTIRPSAIPGVKGFELEGCWLAMSGPVRVEFDRARRLLGAPPPGHALWGELTAVRSMGRRYGPDGQYLCQFSISKVGPLRWSRPWE